MIKRSTSLCILASVLIASITLISCNQNTTPKGEDNKQSEATETKSCYFFAFKTDTVFLSLTQGKDSITGELNYIPYEKDSRFGTLSGGYFIGDTLFALYNSTQEGQTSDCEMAMLKKGDAYILTNDIWGDNYTYNSDYTKGSFVSRAKIEFDGEELKPCNCK